MEDMPGQYEWLGVTKEMVKLCEKGLCLIIWYIMVIIKLKIAELFSDNPMFHALLSTTLSNVDGVYKENLHF